ncbi:MAG TPA: 6,7-dimethyl-8-ribityllumazine synthase [Nitrospiria bacterium]|nr:6,7-dimethyl-8-ribityllumazine synthase [Nitrospiria bacterium]
MARAAANRGLRVAIAASRFNETITARLVSAARAELTAGGVDRRAVTVVYVPGAFELPLAAQWLCRAGRYDAVICLGTVIRGDTPHFDFIARAASQGIMDVGLAEGRPVVFGVLTTETVEQAEERADASRLNRGAEAARTAIEMARLAKRFRREG